MHNPNRIVVEAVEIYTIDNCPYCERAKALLKSRGISYAETHVDKSNDTQIQDLVARSKMRTFPQIFIGGKIIGGYTELEAMDRAGKLA